MLASTKDLDERAVICRSLVEAVERGERLLVGGVVFDAHLPRDDGAASSFRLASQIDARRPRSSRRTATDSSSLTGTRRTSASSRLLFERRVEPFERARTAGSAMVGFGRELEHLTMHPFGALRLLALS